MSGSYSEIFSPSRFKVESVPEEVKPTIQNLAMEGTLMKEGDMVHFIAKNLETKIRLSSPDISGNFFTVYQWNLYTNFICFKNVARH